MKDAAVIWVTGLAGLLLGFTIGALAMRPDHTPDMTRLKATPQSQVCPNGILGTDIKGTIWCIQGATR